MRRIFKAGLAAMRWNLGRKLSLGLALVGFALLAAPPAEASPSDILKVHFFSSGSGWRVEVTIRHADTGWDHYTNVWVVETMDGKQLGKRVLFHPHVNEQPFTRSDSVTVPKGVTRALNPPARLAGSQRAMDTGDFRPAPRGLRYGGQEA